MPDYEVTISNRDGQLIARYDVNNVTDDGAAGDVAIEQFLADFTVDVECVADDA